MAGKLDGYAFITGASGGIGRAVVLGLAEAGVRGIYLTDLKEDTLRRIASESREVATNLNYSSMVRKADVNNEEEINSAVTECHATFGRIDYAINAHGVGEPTLGLFADVKTEEWDSINGVNQRGVFLCMKHQIRAMQKQEPRETKRGRPLERGSIVNIASAAAVIALSLCPAYTATKHAVAGLTRSAAADHAKDSIRVNSVCPGFIDTEFMIPVAEVRPQLEALALLKRYGKAEEVADAVLFLCGPGASYITGHQLMVDGGYTAV